MGFPKRNFGCGAIFSFIFMVGVVVSEVQLLTNPWVEAECGKTLNLRCEVNSSNPASLIIKTLEWVHRKATCDYSPAKTDHRLYCHLQNETSPILLLGTLTNITPDDEGEYFCKIHSNQAIVNEKTIVRVNCCSGSGNITRNGSLLTCQFEGVYPSANIHWLQGLNNLTNASNTTEIQNENGFYGYISTISIEEENAAQNYSCVLSRFPLCDNILEMKSVSNRGTVKVQQNTFVIEMLLMMMTMTFMW